MDQIRLALYAAAAVLLVMIWQAWRAEHATPSSPAAVARGSPVPEGPSVEGYAGAVATPPDSTPKLPVTGDLVTVDTDLLHVELDARGAQLRTLALKRHPVARDQPDTPFPLFTSTPQRSFYLQTGLLGEQVPAREVLFSTPHQYVSLGAKPAVEVPFEWTSAAGLRLRLVYRFERNSYVVGLRYEVHNAASDTWRGEPYAELVRHPGSDAKRSLFNPVSFQGGALYTGADKFQKYSYDDIARHPWSRVLQDGWVAMTEHYFTAALLPPEGTQRRCYTRALPGEHYAIGCVADALSVPPGQAASYAARLYAGPKEQRLLGQVAPGLNLTVDYGLLTVIAQPLFWLLRTIHGYVHNWGVAIILVTLLIKLAFYQLSATSYRSMAHLRQVQPKMLELRERYKDDRPKLNEKMMELYRAEKVNPLGGCLPIVVQIPVFISLYWVLLESVELRQAPFMLWIQDLSAKDPLYVLPLLMGVSMFLQQRMNPTPMEPMQQRVMMVLPVVFTVFFALFPAGLVLYWLVNNVLSIAQQWLITRQMQPGRASA